MAEIDFLRKPSDDHWRRQISNIHDSYSHPWDVLAELLQNSVDAIRSHIKEHGRTEHSISIIVNQRERSVVVRDSGIGISPDGVGLLFAPHGSDKSQKPDLIGEKGVGLTYVIFSSNDFQIKTCSMQGSFSGKIKNASLWRWGKSVDWPKLHGEKGRAASQPSATHTEIFVRDIGDDETDAPDSIFRLGFPALAYVLRTKTSVGSTREESYREPINVKLKVVDINGKPQERKIPFQYMYPQELVGKAQWHVLNEDFVRRMAKSDDRAKAKLLQGKCLLKKGEERGAGWSVRYSAFVVPSRATWKEINQKNELTIATDDGEPLHLYGGTIEIATKGMPTAVTLAPPQGGQTGHWYNLHILIQDDSLPFDIGRKSIPGRTQGRLRDVARKIFNEFRNFTTLMSSDPSISTNATLIQVDKNEKFDDLKKLPDLGIDGIPYIKQPDGQECAVVALFHELAAIEHLKGYHVLKTGYKETYDLWGQYEVRDDNVGCNHRGKVPVGKHVPIVIEFKYKLEDILMDFENSIKQFQDIDLLVCWDIDDSKFAEIDFQVEVISGDDALFHGTNYRLLVPSTFNLGVAGEKPVISLRRLVEDLAKSQK